MRILRNPVFALVSAFNRLSTWLSRSLGLRYQLTMPFATYAPWLGDPAFLELYSRVAPLSCTGLYQCWELWELAGQLAPLPGDVLEVGVWKGATSAILGQSLSRFDTETQLFACDTFEGLVKTSPDDPHLQDGALAGPTASQVRALLDALGVTNYTLLPGVMPDQTGHLLQERTFKLCHIDVDTRRSAEEITDWLLPRLTVGGALVFQDYGYHRTSGIASFVDSLKGRPGLLVIHNLNGSGIVLKTGVTKSCFV